ncbi:uncharacterized protein LOC114223500 isoform X4 [Eumetopias jubatus]|uniref:uncharacterized protein LOC114223500 isoform X4 n=1 Tax=Eumetopias jubatus TaxID=34886 RepID=UPI0010161598|nr:uncharacterized protein LOC114223500 isoform X4 [Eumetopias jubatus]
MEKHRQDGVSDSRTKVCPRPLPSTVQHTHSQCVPCNGSRQQEGSLSASSQPSPSPSSPQQPRCSSKIYDESDNVRGHKLLSAQRALELAAMAAEWGISSLSRQGGVLRPQGAGRGSRACQAFPAPAPEEGSFHSCQLRPLLTAPAQRETRQGLQPLSSWGPSVLPDHPTPCLNSPALTQVQRVLLLGVRKVGWGKTEGQSLTGGQLIFIFLIFLLLLGFPEGTEDGQDQW